MSFYEKASSFIRERERDTRRVLSFECRLTEFFGASSSIFHNLTRELLRIKIYGLSYLIFCLDMQFSLINCQHVCWVQPNKKQSINLDCLFHDIKQFGENFPSVTKFSSAFALDKPGENARYFLDLSTFMANQVRRRSFLLSVCLSSCSHFQPMHQGQEVSEVLRLLPYKTADDLPVQS